jgi:PPOX class probable F420-dependent enzyme
VSLPEELLALLRQRSICYIATTMPDGSPQLTQTWADTDGEHIVINSVQGYVKLRNIQRDPRVAVTITSPDDTSRYFQVRGRVVGSTTEGGAEHIDMLAQKYLGTPYPWFGGRQQVRVIITIAPDHISSMG